MRVRNFNLSVFDTVIAWWDTYVSSNGYTLFEVFMFLAGFLLWVLAYVYIIKNTIKYNFNEMPMVIATGNLAWEFCWSFLFKGDLGNIFMLGCQVWFILDIVINYTSYNIARKKALCHSNNKLNSSIYWFSLVGWLSIVLSMKIEGADSQLGILSALLINVVMSSLYINQVISYPEKRGRGISYQVAWYKMYGTLLISIGGTLHLKGNLYVIALGGLSFMLDVWYIHLFRTYKPALTLVKSIVDKTPVSVKYEETRI